MNQPEGPHLPGPCCPQPGRGLMCRSKQGLWQDHHPGDASLKPDLKQQRHGRTRTTLERARGGGPLGKGLCRRLAQKWVRVQPSRVLQAAKPSACVCPECVLPCGPGRAGASRPRSGESGHGASLQPSTGGELCMGVLWSECFCLSPIPAARLFPGCTDPRLWRHLVS